MRVFHRLTPFGKYVVKTLTDQDMTRVQLAAAIGTSPQFLSSILTGTRPGEKYIPVIITVLALDPQKARQLMAA